MARGASNGTCTMPLFAVQPKSAGWGDTVVSDYQERARTLLHDFMSDPRGFLTSQQAVIPSGASVSIFNGVQGFYGGLARSNIVEFVMAIDAESNEMMRMPIFSLRGCAMRMISAQNAFEFEQARAEAERLWARVRHIDEAFEEALAAPRKRPSVAFWHANDTTSARQDDHHRIRRILDDLLQQAERLSKGEVLPEEAEKYARDYAEVGYDSMRHYIYRRLGESAANDEVQDFAQNLREGMQSLFKHMPNSTAEALLQRSLEVESRELARVQRLARAAQLDERIDISGERAVAMVIEAPEALEQKWYNIFAEDAAGDEEYMFWNSLSNSQQASRTLGKAESAAEAKAMMRRMLACERVFANDRYAWYGNNQEVELPRNHKSMLISCAPAALDELREDLSKSGQPYTLKLVRQRQWSERGDHDLFAEMQFALRHSETSDGASQPGQDRDLMVMARVSLGSSRVYKEDRIRKTMIERARDAGLTNPQDMEIELREDRKYGWNVLGNSLKAQDEAAPEEIVKRVDSLDAWLGPENCNHKEGRWIDLPGYGLSLACRHCRRSRIALIPPHRLPSSRRGALSDPQEYVNRYRGRRALRGEEISAETSFYDLVHSEGLADLRPGSYAVVNGEIARAGDGDVVRPMRRARSLRAALRG